MSQENEKTDAGAQPIAEVDRIRDIIFGPQMHVYEKQFKRMTAELDSVSKQLEEIQAAQDQQVTDRESRLRKFQEDLQQRNSDLERTLAGQLETGLEQQGAQTRKLAADLQKQGKDLRGEFRSALDDLEDDKTSRQSLGDLLVEMGTRLKDQAGLSDLLGQLEAAAKDQSE